MSNIDFAQVVTADDKAAEADDAYRARVNAERTRRLTAGVIVALEGYGDVPLQGREVDQINLLALKDTARDMAVADITAAVLPFRDAENASHMLTPAQMIDLADKGKQVASAIYAASWALKAADPRPADPSDD